MPLSEDDENVKNRRIRILYEIFILIFVIYTGRLFALQVLQGNIYRSRSDIITRKSLTLPAQRGEIYTREYSTPVVGNMNSFSVFISPMELKGDELSEIINKLSALLEIPKKQIEKKIPAQTTHQFQPVEVASNVSYNKIAMLAEHSDALNTVSWQSKPIRDYSNTGGLSHVVGYIGNITQDEFITFYNLGYDQNDIIGKTGIERQYDSVLRGQKGSEVQVINALGQSITENIIRQSPEPGKNLVLTIDRDIQLLTEKALGKRIGAVVVLRPQTGEILAMASYPWYNPSVFLDNETNSEYQKILNDSQKPLINRAIQSSYPPGSTFKIIMTTGILGENAISPEKTIKCPGEIAYGDRTWRCHIGKPGHGYMNLRRALAQSCDIYYWVAGRDYLGINNISAYAKDYGLGALTGIDIPGETAGFIPTPDWKERNFHENWLGGDSMNASIGQGWIMTTPIQMANVVAMTVNDGIIYQPHLLKEIRDPLTNNVLETAENKVLHKSEIDKNIFERVRSDMRAVISEGTAQYPLNTVKATQIAGKTGTSEVGLANRWHSWFAAYAPYNGDPDEQIVVSIIVEAVNRWEWWSPYASSIIFQGIFGHQTYEEAVKTLNFQYLMPAEERPN
ncbi:MAG: penicillin-binding protein 2 [Spirochaetaceae bacterium]|jgi:penicillin-binding protein 2|nr:penicillin-binding protein 2 [Spirochaetaceae bacterium]